MEEKNGTYPRKSDVGQLGKKAIGCRNRILSCLKYFESQKTEVKGDVELLLGKCPYNVGQQAIQCFEVETEWVQNNA